MITSMTTILKCASLVATSIDLGSLLIVHLMTVGRVVMHKLLSVMILYHQPVLNAVIDMIAQFLVHREMLHARSLIDQIYV